MDQENQTMEPQQKVRPTFLTVLCILTFIGSGWGIYDGFTDYLFADTAEDAIGLVDDQLEDAMDEMEDSDASEGMVNFMDALFGNLKDNLTSEKIRASAMWNGLSCIFTLLGAIFMWRLNRMGYFIYIVGILLFIISPLIVFDGMMGSMAAAGNGFIGILFGILYGVNLKHMS